MRVVIVGAGIGGLTTAIALRQRGIDAVVLERAPELRDVGAGISLWPNAVKLLDRLGVGQQLREISVTSYVGGVHRYDGRMLAPADSADLVARFGAPMLILHRAELIDALYRAAGTETVVLGASVSEIDTDGASVRVRTADGRSFDGDVLVGADGIRSVVRRHLFPDSLPQYSGQTCWRGVTPYRAPAGADFWGETWGAGRRFGLLPLHGDRAYWFATYNAPEHRPDSPDGHQEEVLRLFRGWHAPIGDLIASTPPAAFLRNDLYDLAPLSTWTRGNVTMLGDAAHATTPNLGQGGCQAIEDAWVLARSIAEGSTIAEALRAYETERVERATWITRTSRRIGAVGNWSHPLACWLRNAMTAWTPESARLRMLEPIVGYDPR